MPWAQYRASENRVEFFIRPFVCSKLILSNLAKIAALSIYVSDS